MKHPFQRLRTNRLSIKIILMVEVVLILSNSVFCVVSIINSRMGIRRSIQQRMLDIANCASGSVNGDILGSLTAEDEGTAKYKAVYDTLAIFRDNVELEYVYSIRDEGDGRFTFIVDTDPVAPGAFGSEVKYTQALADAGAGVANRNAGETAIVQAMLEGSGCLALFGLDHLSQISKTGGNAFVERVFRLLDDVLAENSGDSLYCELGGSEFLFFMKGVCRAEAEARVRTIIDTFNRRKLDDAGIAEVSLAAGLAMCTPDEPYSIIYYKADKALHAEVENGGSGYTFYNADPAFTELGKADVNRIVRGIQQSGSYNGALEVEYRQFVRLYEYISNLDRRFSHPFKLILISLDPAAGETPEAAELEREMGFMEQAIRQSIRNVDIITRYGRQQFLIILLGTDPDGARLTVDRIFRGYFKMNGSSVYMPAYFIAEMAQIAEN